MEIFKTKWLSRFTRQAEISDGSLRDAVERADRGLVDADLGGGLIKQRVARAGQGRSGGYRMIIAYRTESRAVFLYAFAKNERENIGRDELAELRQVGANWVECSAQFIAAALKTGALEEVESDEEES